MSQEAESSHPLLQLLRISDALVGIVVLGMVLMLIDQDSRDRGGPG